MMRALLDINVLLALLDADHVDHRRAQDWISGEIQHGWASCALTQNGFVRIISQPRYPSPVSPFEAVERLRRATSTEYPILALLHQSRRPPGELQPRSRATPGDRCLPPRACRGAWRKVCHLRSLHPAIGGSRCYPRIL